MKIVIFGANGKIGSRLVKQALAEGHFVIAYMRRIGGWKLEHPNLKVMIGNMDETLRIRDAISGADVCISTLGSRMGCAQSTSFIEAIYNIVNTMESERVVRFVYVSRLGAGESYFFIRQPMRLFYNFLMLRFHLRCHTINESRIDRSNLKWTIIRPGKIYDKIENRSYKHGWKRIKLNFIPVISLQNTVNFIVTQLTDTSYINKHVWLVE